MTRRLGTALLAWGALTGALLAGEVRREATAEEFDQMIALVEMLRSGKMGQPLTAEQVREMDEALAELRAQRASIPPDGTYKFPTREEMRQELLALKRSPDWAAMSERDRREVDEALRELAREPPPEREEDGAREPEGAVPQAVPVGPCLVREKGGKGEGGVFRLSRPDRGRVTQRRFVPSSTR